MEHSYPCPGGSDTKGRTLGRSHHGHLNCVGLYPEEGKKISCNDRRNNSSWKSSACRRNQGEDTCCQTGKNQGDNHFGREQERCGGYKVYLYKRVEVPLC